MLILDFLLFLIIGICIAYCWILNRRIQDLQNSRIEFARMIKELNVSIIKAENSVTELKGLSNSVGNELKASIEVAKDNCSRLMGLNDIAIDLMEKLERQTASIENEQSGKFTSPIIQETVDNNELKKSNSRFNDDDFVNDELLDEPKVNYTNHLKNFLTNIVTRKTESNVNLSQTSYYDTLRKINAKK